MANIYGLNIQDASLEPAVFALPNAASASTQSAAVDLGIDAWKIEHMELLVSIPALTTVMVPDTKTVTMIVETSTTSNFAAIVSTILYNVLTGAGGAGVAAASFRVRLPSNCSEFVRFRVLTGANVTDCSSLNGTLQVLF